MPKKKKPFYSVRELAHDCNACFWVNDEELRLELQDWIWKKIKGWKYECTRKNTWHIQAQNIADFCNELLKIEKSSESSKALVKFLLNSLYYEKWLTYTHFTWGETL